MKKKLKNRLLPLQLLCIVVLLTAGTMLFRDLNRYHRERTANQNLSRQIKQARESADIDQNSPSALPSQYTGLKRQNEDFAGWLFIENTAIDYPVMYTPDDPEHYLHRAFDGSYAQSGTLFIDASCLPESDHILIHGHHMKDGSMFGTLPQYQDQEFAGEHSVIRFDTPDEEGYYELLAAFYTKIDPAPADDAFQYYKYTDLSDPEDFAAYIQQIKKLSLYDTGIQAVDGDRLLTLSTCSYHTDEGRFVVVAVRKQP